MSCKAHFIEQFVKAVESGQVQSYIDDGYTITDLMSKYSVSRNRVRFYPGLKFKHCGGKAAKQKPIYATWSEAKIQALCKPW